ncbi:MULTISPECIES: hypothetical protein [unclassified Mesorhizobium]|jgi:hypothetical protein|uniref:hypothetical protein n=1 Tax=unclassified Mesorhizobium TaxID=325217 RepID=UPI0012E36465|nr:MULTISPECIES: hypothetical protein [unclassified Mesorhizobium]
MEHRFDEILKLKAIDTELSHSGSRSAIEISGVGQEHLKRSQALFGAGRVLVLPFEIMFHNISRDVV